MGGFPYLMFDAGLVICFLISSAAWLALMFIAENIAKRSQRRPPITPSKPPENPLARMAIVGGKFAVFGLVLPVGTTAALLIAFCYFGSIKPDLNFAGIIGVKQPSSVRVLRAGFTGMLEPTLWIHFTIDPKDLRRVINKGHYSLSENEEFSDTDANSPAWWRPGAHGRWRTYHYELPPGVDPDDVEDSDVTLIVSPDGHDVYARKFEPM